MILAHGLPVEAVPGDLLLQYPRSPCPVDVGIKQGRGRNLVSAYPPAVDLHQSHVNGFPGGLCLPDQGFGLLSGGRAVRSARHSDGQGIQAGFLPGHGLNQGGRRLLRFRVHGEQNDKQQHGDHFFHWSQTRLLR